MYFLIIAAFNCFLFQHFDSAVFVNGSVWKGS
jgi:hypothetical protein